MRHLKNIALACLLLIFTNTLQAQDTTNPSESVKKSVIRNVKTLKNKLVLSVSQTEKITEHVTKYETAKYEIYLSKDEMEMKNKKLSELEEAHHKRIEEELSEAQRKKFIAAIADSKKGV
ncbi:hypothetical protein [Aquimarina agarivorans]|uniref:hypothetical protein n=1 Tax=Aquimarina agarivorans TaxID=980584 RepID=UPI000248E5E9|nr:hypothetical protein [Aquimarina agarivorans]